MTDDYPDPEKQVEPLVDPTEPGVTYDILADGTADAHAAHYHLMSMATLLDHVLDDQGLFPDEFHRDGREIQQRLKEMAEWADEYREAMKDRAGDYRNPGAYL